MSMVIKLILCSASVLWSAIGLSSFGQGQPKEIRHYVIESGDFYFDPPGLLIQPGDIVEWVFVEITVDGHTTTAYHPTFMKELRMPENAKPWDSEIILDKSKTYSVTLDAVGVYDYFCLFHEFLGMIGRLVVKEPAGPVIAKPTIPGLPPAALKEMPSIDEIMGAIGKIFNFTGELNDVVHLHRQKDQKKSSERLGRLLDELRDGMSRDDSLFAVLKKVNLYNEVEKALQELRSAIASNAPIEDVEKLSKSVKSLLSDARKKLKAN
jgi:plastocyanin